MDTRRFPSFVIFAFYVALAGCAASPLEEQKRMEMEADIDDILSHELDPAEYGETQSCLRETEFRRYRPLGNRHLLFEGRQGRLWVNVLRGRCPGLDSNSVFITKPNLAGRLCELDRFSVVDRFGALPSADTSRTCVLGEFKPVTEDQVKEVENRLEMR